MKSTTFIKKSIALFAALTLSLTTLSPVASASSQKKPNESQMQSITKLFAKYDWEINDVEFTKISYSSFTNQSKNLVRALELNSQSLGMSGTKQNTTFAGSKLYTLPYTQYQYSLFFYANMNALGKTIHQAGVEVNVKGAEEFYTKDGRTIHGIDYDKHEIIYNVYNYLATKNNQPLSLNKTQSAYNIKGVISKIEKDGKNMALLINEGIKNFSKYDSAIIVTNEATTFQFLGENKKALASDFKVGDVVEVVLNGGIIPGSKDPIQGVAKNIAIEKSPLVPNKSAQFSGTVIVPKATNLKSTILVEDQTADVSGYMMAYVGINSATKITKYGVDSQNATKPFTISDIKPGDRVEIVFEGEVSEDFPHRATAKTINIYATPLY